ncbi:hypothetical protein J4558_22185 [Leptolyngbya sp. 15MV]|nr:hypothetical protein J4558_22185 [Leptolyngbya sp. 15MV]
MLRPVLPSQPARLPWAGHMGLRMLPDLLAALDPAMATLIFCNTRAQAELWYQAIRFERPDWSEVLALHHGSLERAERERVEAGVKSGAIRLVVCTSSLDLGVDFAPVERVVQIGSPKGIARLLQRAGRSGHRPGESSTILCVPTHQMELVEIAAVRRALARGDIEPRLPLDKPLDVLAQHLVTCALGRGFVEEELLAEVRTTRAYATLTDQEFAWAMSLVREGGTTLRRYAEYRKIEQRLEPGDAAPRYRVTTPRIAQLHRLNLGTITQGGSVAIRYASGRRLGSIDEPFITGLEPGQRFLFAGRTVELVRIEALEAIVRPARGRTTLTPHWSGIRLPISEALSAEIRAVLAEAASPCSEPASDSRGPELEAARELLSIQGTLSRLPMPGETLAEVTTTRDGRHLFLFPFEGRAVHAGLAALLALRLARCASARLLSVVNCTIVQPRARHCAMAHSIIASPTRAPRAADATRTASIWPRQAPLRDRPGRKAIWNVPITAPSRSATASNWFASASMAAKASR